eukprot:TRINITY_DN12341_c0_g2_i2.p1 TRINITY_DN12341_c0_g2~~TRINITY_DN12341_c0_g2_i2.p1  ORF type:complete len:224 (+),score=48.33 TRINITY_DN12341_c0_g2_i2:697-1368(+)
MPELSEGLLETYMAHFDLNRKQVVEQKAAFDFLDQDGNGSLTFEEVKAMNAKLDTPMTTEELSVQFKELDVNSDGRIEFKEFLKVYVLGAFGRNVCVANMRDSMPPDVIPPSPKPKKHSALDAIEEDKPFEMKLSAKNNVGFYVRAARRILKGSEDASPVAKMRISALGNSINTAVAVAVRLGKDGLAEINKVHTAYPDMSAGGEHSERGCAQISIDVVSSTS